MAEGITLRTLNSELTLGTRGWDSGMKKVGNDTTKIGGLMKKSSAAVKRFGVAMVAAGAAITVTLGLFAKFAMDAEESENLFEVSMGNMADATREWSEELSTSLGLNSFEVRRMTGVFNAMFTAMKFGSEDAFHMSTMLTEMANDMASFYNLPVDVAFQKLQAGITGEIEPLKRLGIMMDVATVSQEEFFKSMGKTWNQLTENEKVMVRFNSLISQTELSHGDLEKTLDSATNTIRILGSAWDEVRVELGKALLPTIKDVGGELKEILFATREYIKNNQEMVSTVVVGTGKLGVFAFILGAGVIAMGEFIEGIVEIIAVMKILGATTLWAHVTNPILSLQLAFIGLTAWTRALGVTVLANLRNPILSLRLAFISLRASALWTWGAIAAPVIAVVAAIAAVGLAIFTLRGMWKQNTFNMQRHVKQLWEALVKGTKATFQAIGSFAKDFFFYLVDVVAGPVKTIGGFFKYLFVDYIGAGMKFATNKFIGFFSGLGAIAGTAWAKIKSGDFSNFFGDLTDAFVGEANKDHLSQALQNWINGLSGDGIMGNITKKITNAAKIAKKQLTEGWENFTTDMADAATIAGELLEEVWESVKGAADIGGDFATYFVQGFREALPDLMQQARLDINNLLGTNFFQDSWSVQDWRAKNARDLQQIREDAGLGPRITYQPGGGAPSAAGVNYPGGYGGLESYGQPYYDPVETPLSQIPPQPITVVVQNNLSEENLAKAVVSSQAGQEGIVYAVMNDFFQGGVTRTTLSPQPQ